MPQLLGYLGFITVFILLFLPLSFVIQGDSEELLRYTFTPFALGIVVESPERSEGLQRIARAEGNAQIIKSRIMN